MVIVGACARYALVTPFEFRLTTGFTPAVTEIGVLPVTEETDPD
jgi:hypothetical protein